MSHPYRVTLERLAGDALFVVERGVPPAKTDPVVVADGLTRKVGFSNDQVPGEVEPVTVTCSLAALTPDALPPLVTGDLWRVTIELSADGQEWFTYSSDVMRLGEPELTLNPQARRPVIASLTFTDLMADLASRFPQPDVYVGTEPAWWLDEWAHLSSRDLNVWYPTEWTDAWNVFEMVPTVPSESAAAQLAKFAAGYPVDGELWTLRPRYSTDRPDPAVWVGAGLKPPPDQPEWTPPTPNLANPIGYLFQKLNRTMPAGSLLPFVLADTPAGVGIVNAGTDPADSTGLAILPSRVLTVPTEARRARDTTPNTHVVAGYRMVFADGEVNFEDSTTEIPAASLTPTDPRVSRSIETLNVFRVEDSSNPNAGNAATRQRIEALRLAYEPDLGPVTADWSFDDLTVRTDEMTPTEYVALVPMLNIAGPEDDGDQVPVRPVAATDVATAVDLTGRRTIAGTLTRVTLTITAGTITLAARLSPGVPPLHDDTGITAADLPSSPWPALTVADLDPTLTALDMRLVSADW